MPAADVREADTRAASRRYTEDQLKIATALFAIIMSARQQNLGNEAILRRSLGKRLPDTKHVFALIPPSQDSQHNAVHQDWEGLLEVLLKGAKTPVLDALARLAKLCVVSELTPVEFFRQELANYADSALNPQESAKGAPASSMSSPADSAADTAAGVSRNGQPDFHTMVSLDKIRPDLARLVDFMRIKLAHGSGKAWQKYKRLYDAVFPGDQSTSCRHDVTVLLIGVPIFSCLMRRAYMHWSFELINDLPQECCRVHRRRLWV